MKVHELRALLVGLDDDAEIIVKIGNNDKGVVADYIRLPKGSESIVTRTGNHLNNVVVMGVTSQIVSFEINEAQALLENKSSSQAFEFLAKEELEEMSHLNRMLYAGRYLEYRNDDWAKAWLRIYMRTGWLVEESVKAILAKYYQSL